MRTHAFHHAPAVVAAALISAATLFAQQAPPAAPASAPEQKAWTNADDHQNMMAQLGITTLRPGPSGNPQAPNHANEDESAANPFPNLPDPLTLKDGRRVTTADMWWKVRRPEIVEDFEREVVGRIPSTVPAVTWSVTATTPIKVGDRQATEKTLVGHVDNSGAPGITVDIQASLVTPADAKGPVPVMIMFRWGNPPAPGQPAPSFGPPPPPGSDPPGTEQLIAAGWGYVFVYPGKHSG